VSEPQGSDLMTTSSSGQLPGGSGVAVSLRWLRSTHPIVVTVLAFVVSVIVGGLLIVVTD